MSAQPSQIAWPLVIEDIAYLLGDELPGTPAREPVSQHAVADLLGVPRSTLRNWADGAQPKHSDGEKLLAAWCSLSGKARQFAPRERRPMSAARFN
jgi:hypothetical protein